MYITCSNCQARYIVSASQIGPEGRKVKCTKCNESWFQEPAAEAEQIIAKKIKKEAHPIEPVQSIRKENIKAQSTIRNLPIVVKKPQLFFAPTWLKYGTYLNIIIALILLAIVHAGSITHYLPDAKELYTSVGLYPTDSMTIEEVEVVTIPQITGENEMIIKGVIASHAQEKRKINMHISLYDKHANKLAEHPIHMDDSELQPREKSFFRIPIVMSELPKEASHLALDIGNPVEQQMR